MRPRLVALLEPYLGSVAALVVPGYAFMLGLGALLGAMLTLDRARRAGFSREATLAVLARTYVAGLAGACAVPLGQGALAWLGGGGFAPPTGMAAYGGLVGGTVGAILALRARKMAVAPFLDAGAPAVGLGYFFARIGCFLAGCDYGAPTASALGATFPAGSYAFRDHVARGLVDARAAESLPVHPTQLYSSLAGLALYVVVSRLPVTRPGFRFASMVLGYATVRAAIEALRGDATRGHLGPLSTSQVFAIATAALAAAFVLKSAVGVRSGR